MRVFLSAALAAWPWAAQGQARPSVAVQDGLGRPVTVGPPPQRIVSTVPSNTEILYDLGLRDRVIAATSHCGKTCDVSGKVILGGWAQPAIVEKIAEVKPDLVVAFGGLQSPLAAELDKRKIAVFVFFPTTVEETLQQILSVGKITGTGQKAHEIVARCRGSLARIEKTLRDLPPKRRVKCVRLMSTEARVIGGGSFQSDMIARAGGVNVFAHVPDDYPIVSLYDVQSKDPDMIILNRDNEREAVAWFLSQAQWSQIRAAKQGRLISISCDFLCHPNSRIDKTVEMLARRLYPDRFGGRTP